ncbi:MAG: DUF1801 domain-containing protein [Bryobacterales bacterium]|nr:DUF1801 domain-containing protein [Bryobacterales bacterium]
MAKTAYQTIDEYIAAKQDTLRPVLERVRGAIAKALPGAEEVISYQIPAFKLNGKVVIFFAGWREHFSIYPAGPGVLAAFADDLKGYTVSKGTIQFPLDRPVPVRLISRIAKFMAEEAAKRAAAKKKQPRAKKVSPRPEDVARPTKREAG